MLVGRVDVVEVVGGVLAHPHHVELVEPPLYIRRPERQRLGGQRSSRPVVEGVALGQRHAADLLDEAAARALDRALIYNRCDGGFEARASRLVLSLSTDGKTFEKIYQHDGTAFRGQPDGTASPRL